MSMSSSCLASMTTCLVVTLPSYGQPHTHDRYTRTRMPARRAAAAVSIAVFTASATDLLMFFFEWPSVTERNMQASSSFAAIARSRPFRFGTSAEKITPGRRSTFAITSEAFAILGIHFGDTDDVDSMRFDPASI